MSSRDQILNRLGSRKRDVPLPERWQSRRHFANPADRFSEALIAAKGEVHRANSLDEAWQQLDALLIELDVEKGVVNQRPPLDSVAWQQRWSQVAWYVVGQSEGNLRQFCETADVGISSAEIALAETGTIGIQSGTGQSRLATLLPPVHVALVPTSRLETDIFTWSSTSKWTSAPPANFTFVSGPSKTADIEQTLAIGVHGPKQFVVILYEETTG